MKDQHPTHGIFSSDTYLGAKMNRKTLDFHTQLHEWSESQKYSTISMKKSQLITSPKNKDVHLPFQKLAHINNWTRQVNRYYLPSTGGRPQSGSFMKIDVTKYNMKADKNEKPRSRSALYHPASATDRSHSNGRKRFFGTDVHTVNNNLIESQMHYSAQRRDLHSAHTRKSTKSSKAIDSKLQDSDPVIFDITNNEDQCNETSNASTSDKNENTKQSDLDSQVQGHTDTEVMQPQIVARSWSNRMLNVISIDDCKLTCRYRPQIIKENHAVPEDYDEMDRARANKVKRDVTEKTKIEKKVKDVNGNEADDGEDSIQDVVAVKEEIGNSLTVDDSIVDTNNNNEADACHDIKVSSSDTNKTNDTEDDNHLKSTDIKTNGTENQEKKYFEINKIEEVDETEVRCVSSEGSSEKTDKDEKKSSDYDTKTSYGRLTTLYSNSNTDKSKTKEKKKMSRVSRINYAIEDMIKERKVMNSLERDFETRTAEYGRTIVEKSEGSESFKKRHANLRRKIDNFVNTHSALKTLEFYERRSRCNSASNSTVNS